MLLDESDQDALPVRVFAADELEPIVSNVRRDVQITIPESTAGLRVGNSLGEVTGNLLEDYAQFLRLGCNLAILPIARVHVELEPHVYRGMVTFYPPGVSLDCLNPVPNRQDTTSLAEACSAASGITPDVLEEHVLVVFPCSFDFSQVWRTAHAGRMDLLRWLSELVDRLCLDHLRYRLCRLDLVDTLPARAGQVHGNPMMAGAMLFSVEFHEATLIGGDAFTHAITRGLGLSLESVDDSDFGQSGEVGHIVDHALALYSALLEAGNLSTKFVQAMSLLDFLANPHEYEQFKKAKRIIARYVAHNSVEYDALLGRFQELTGPTGLRTNIVHLGQRLESLVPSTEERRALFGELDRYIRMAIEHMRSHSGRTWSDYLEERSKLQPFGNGRRTT